MYIQSKGLSMIEIFEEFAKFNNIVFYDDTHKYLIDGKEAISATKLLGMFKKPFDTEFWAAKKAAQEGITKEEMKARWELKSRISTEKGTAVHSYIENRLSNKVFPYPAKEISAVFEGADPVRPLYDKILPLAERFVSDIRGKMIPIKSELVVGDAEYGLCGMIDQVFYNKKSKQLELWDWKTNKEISTSSQYKLQAPLSNLDDSELTVYSLQLNLYKHIIEKNTNLKFGKSYLVWFNEANESYQIIPCNDVSAEIPKMIKHFLDNKKKSK